jgi:hypothetical protein
MKTFREFKETETETDLDEGASSILRAKHYLRVAEPRAKGDAIVAQAKGDKEAEAKANKRLSFIQHVKNNMDLRKLAFESTEIDPTYNKYGGNPKQAFINKNPNGTIRSTSVEYADKNGFYSHSSKVDNNLEDHINHIKHLVKSGVPTYTSAPDRSTVKVSPENVDSHVESIRTAHTGILPKEYSDYASQQKAKQKAEQQKRNSMSQSEKDDIQRKAVYGGDPNKGSGLGT